MNWFAAGAAGVLLLHLTWILWVVLGCLATRGRRRLARLHIGSLLYSIGIELTSRPCPLTGLEQQLQQQAGVIPYRGGFLAHYLERLVYPDVPQRLLVSGAVAVCLFNLGVYVRRWRRR